MAHNKLKILAIDDFADNLISIKAQIKDTFPEATLLTASNGVDGLMIAAVEDPDVILLDIIMPGMDGFEVCRKIKKDKKLADIPIIFLTALKGDKANRIMALEAGAEAFLAKPVDETELKAQLGAMLKIRQANIEKRTEKDRLSQLVKLRTIELEKELIKQRKTEDELRKSEARYKSLYEERQQIIHDLLLAKEKAQESDRLKSAFLANMSHEIRTPMNGILGFAQLLQERNVSEDQKRKFLEIIEISGQRMLSIINDLINISKIESGQMEVILSEVNVNKEMSFLFDFFEPETLKKKSQVILVNQMPDLVVSIISDKEKVVAVLTNLIKNAIKHTHEGVIAYGFTIASDHLEFYVKDTGPGIPESKRDIIFERFSQVESKENGQTEGAGLGLAIAKAYVELLGGKIWLDGEEKPGATFRFTLPFVSIPAKQ